jgi:hypothetical protein
MKIISHRGNLNGANLKLENTEEYIDVALENGFDVEIDLWKINNEYFLGHDKPCNEVSLEWIENRKHKLWIHTKNFNAFESLLKINREFIFFYFTLEPLVLVSNGKIWTHSPEKIANPKNCIIPLLEKNTVRKNQYNEWFGICTDYPLKLRNHHL